MIRDIIFINDYAWVPGGLQKVVVDGALGLAANGARVTFIALIGPIDDALLSAGIDVRCMGQPDIWEDPNKLAAMARGVWNKSAMDFVRRQLMEFDPASSVIHCQGYNRALSPAIGKLMTESGFTHVMSMHDYALACPNGTFFNHREKAICTRTPLGLSCLTTNCDARSPHHKVWRVARHLAGDRFGGLPHKIQDLIYVSELQRTVMEPFLSRSTRLHYVPNPVSCGKADRIRAEDNELFLFVSRLVPEKGAVLFAKAAKAAGAKAVFVGDGPDREAVQAVFPEAQITGWVSPAEVEAWLGKARCLVFPSLWYETQGLAVQEALAKGVPVMCGKWTAASASVRDGRNGFVLPDPDPGSWARCIENVMKIDVAELSHNAFGDYWASAVDRAEHARHLMMVYEKAHAAQQASDPPAGAQFAGRSQTGTR